MLTVSHLTKRYHKLLANDDLNFTIEPGETTVLAGPNGAGKSTAINASRGFFGMKEASGSAPIPISNWRPSGCLGISRKFPLRMIP